MTFHDGEPVTAEDVQFSFEYGAEHSPTKETRAEPIESIDVETDLDLVFNLEEPNAPFLTNALGRVFIIPQHIWEDVPDDVEAETPIDWQNAEAIGSGPFQVESADFAEQIQLSAYEDHFQPPNVDQLTRAVVSDVRAGIRAYEDDAVDMMSWELPVDDLERFEQEEETALESSLMMSIHHMGYNLREPPFDDVDVRQAVAHAVPQETIIGTIYGGTGEIIHNPISPGFDEWYLDDVDAFESETDVTMQMLDDIGFQWDDDMRLHYPPDY
ncbi:ABC transporter substrate-binding protein [Natrialba swarupiae]|nr:ABC transporter substrate-binding protein [Natrialba swarupiae]